VVTDSELDAIFRVDPVSGDRTILSDDNNGSGPALISPSGIALADDGSLIVVDGGLLAVVQVDPVTGDRTTLSDATNGSGIDFISPFEIAIDAEGTLVVTDFGLGSIVCIDPVSGNRVICSGITAVEDILSPPNYSIVQSIPNPFKATTTINYEARVSGLVEVGIYNMLGHQVRGLVNERIPAGDHIVEWDGRNDDGQRLPSGTYFVQMKGQKFVGVRKLMLLK